MAREAEWGRDLNRCRVIRRRPLLLMVLAASVVCLAACQGGTSGQVVTVGAASAAPDSQATLLVVGSGLLKITITSPADEMVVGVPQVEVAGQAPPEAVITINDIVVVVGATGQFSATVPLQAGPNELDVLATDTDGNQASAKLIVTYDPPG